MNNFERAMTWRRYGVSAIPLGYRTKRPLVRWLQYANTPPKPVELKRYFLDNGEKNLGVLCGGKFNLLVIDFDTDDGYEQFMTDADSIMYGILKNTYKVKTPRGVHVYCRSNEPVRSFSDTQRKIDIKADRSYVVAPCSLHPSGTTYDEMMPLDPSKILPVSTKAILSHFYDNQDITPTSKIDWDSVGFNDQNDGFLDGNADLIDIRRKHPILRLAMDYTSMFPEPSRKFWKGKCPLPTHEDKDPSFWINVEKGICGCFGNCVLADKATDVIGLYAHLHSISYGDAINELRNQ